LRAAVTCACLLLFLATIQESNAQDDFRGRLEHPIHSLLLEKESPILRIQWSGEVFVDAPLGNEPPGAQLTLRRARLKFHRNLGPDWQVKLTANYVTDDHFEVDDSYLVYTGWSTVLVKLGINSPPFSLESTSGAASLTFMEEALNVAALAERRSGGISMVKRTPSSILNASLLFFSPKDEGLSSSGQAVVLRYVHAPIDILGRKGVNLGTSFSYRINVSSGETQFRSRPEIATSDTYFVDTGEISGANKIMRTGFEASQVNGRFSWQSELLAVRVERDSAPATGFWGANVFASWFLTGDQRNYDLGQGRFMPQQVSNPLFRGGKGAVELAARASYVDLQDEDIQGGRESNFSLGINWYLNNQLRLSGNMIKVLDINRPGSEFDGSDPLIWAVRLQWLIQ
jgi:phosphate-selective porin OprO/OprP